jgi:hypothetical protein
MRRMRKQRKMMKKELQNPSQPQRRRPLKQNLHAKSDWVDHRRISRLAGTLQMIQKDLRQSGAEAGVDLDEVVDDGKTEEDLHMSHNNLSTRRAT